MKNKLLTYSLRGIGAILLLLVASIILYRIFIFPDEVRKDCAYEALNYASQKWDNVIEGNLDYEFMYRFCLNKNGLKDNQ